MNITPIQWNDEYCIGTDMVDKAHKKIFSIMNKITALLSEGNQEKTVFAVNETIKFLENYTLQHFAEEEAYMKSIGYDGYAFHKSLHDNLRDITLPSMKEELEKSNYGTEAIECFISIFAGWLTGHILIDDRAITGRVSSRHSMNPDFDNIDALDSEVKLLLEDFFRLEASTFDRHYSGQQIPPSMYYEIKYTSSNNREYTVDLITEERMVIYMSSVIGGIQSGRLDKPTIMAYVQFAQGITKQALAMLDNSDSFTLTSHKMVSLDSLKARFEKSQPDYSIMWTTPQGYIGLCIQ